MSCALRSCAFEAGAPARAAVGSAARFSEAVGAARRLPCDARAPGPRQNSLRCLRQLRSNNRRESDHEAGLSFGRPAAGRTALLGASQAHAALPTAARAGVEVGGESSLRRVRVEATALRIADFAAIKVDKTCMPHPPCGTSQVLRTPRLGRGITPASMLPARPCLNNASRQAEGEGRQSRSCRQDQAQRPCARGPARRGRFVRRREAQRTRPQACRRTGLLRDLTRGICLSGAAAGSAASSAAGRVREHRSGVGTQCRPPHSEPAAGRFSRAAPQYKCAERERTANQLSACADQAETTRLEQLSERRETQHHGL